MNGAHFRITVLEEFGFLDVHPRPDGTFRYSGYLIEILVSLSQRANFTYDLLPPSGLGSDCTPRVSDTNSTEKALLYHAVYRTQYNCGANDVTERYNSTEPTDIYLGMYYITPERQVQNQFTIPISPPYGGLAMMGTAVNVPNFTTLSQRADIRTCAPAGTALLDFVQSSFPGLQVDGLLGTGEEDILAALQDGTCEVYIVDGPIATQFILRRSKENRCLADNGMPLGLIGVPLQFGLSQYGIGIRQDIRIEVERTLSYWLNVLMICNPLDQDGDCPEGNLASFYDGYGGKGDECGYVLYPPEPNQPNTSLIVGGVFASLVFLGALGWAFLRHRLHRQARSFAKKAKAVMEQANREREFTDLLAHEIRNPLASAIAALNFVSAKAGDPVVIPIQDNRTTMRSDITVIESSLQFVNDLLRNMLDLHRSANRQLKLDVTTVDVLRDVIEPVASILFMRGSHIEIITDCPKYLAIETDRMRLKQIILNLAANASKFVEKGYIKLRAAILDDNVHLYVEDSGPGVPTEKRAKLFAKYQDSLDSLNQGTGIGLSVCKNLSEAMGANLFLDESFDSGVPFCPGTRFTLRMNMKPLEIDDFKELGPDDGTPESCGELPCDVSVLFVDDDTILRKMFARTIHRVAPTWKIQEACNGETALRMVEKERYDLIFMDQYMASVDKQLLGTETVIQMRARGTQSIICGISANDKGKQFMEAGADGFLFKPFPCDKEALKVELQKLFASGEKMNSWSTGTSVHM